ncbi:hypothetical protein VTL71DRAFT_11414 [Oculimacula yallundae]|uniref:DUF7726 domain-containing protein n=1 Tax=Oculimacula yallundae TaxID=86028 RepID=A0ABR4CQ38_9HELO
MAANTPSSRMPLGEVTSNTVVAVPDQNSSKKAALSNKRKADAEKPDYRFVEEQETVTISCNAVRAKIRRFLESGEMKVGEFQRAIHTNSVTYGRFMNQSGPHKGSGSTVYGNAFAFFKLRELNGVKITKKKKVEEGISAAVGGKAAEKTSTDFGDMILEGEEENKVPVYDSCDEIRRKIRQYLSKTAMNQAAFSREIAKSFHPGKKVSGLAAFMGKKGPVSGNTSSAFYGSYVFFEKMRIKNKNPKTEHRLGMEDAWDGLDSFDTAGPGMNVKKILDK